jgi:hypothetical protein
MKEFISPSDKFKMNWIEGTTQWGTVKCPEGMTVEITRTEEENGLRETYVFKNATDIDMITCQGEIGIYTPFNDDYTSSEICVKTRCHTHIFTGEDVAYVMALRMGGMPPHLGLTVLKGSIVNYSVERDLSKRSNDRGDFILHPEHMCLKPNETYTVVLRLFWHEGKEDFYNKIKEINPRFIAVNADNFTVFENESVSFSVTPNFEFSKEDVNITYNNEPVAFTLKDGVISVNEAPRALGELKYSIIIKGVRTHVCMFVSPEFYSLVDTRLDFIIKKQQYLIKGSKLFGAYLPYDNEEKHIFYNLNPNYNGGRERLGMGILMAAYLQHKKNEEWQKSLDLYQEYVTRELFNVNNGDVYNDFNSYDPDRRLYNYPWITLFYIELYRLKKDRQLLTYAYLSLKRYYEKGGTHFYAFPIPALMLYRLLDKENMTAERDRIFTFCGEQADFILKNGLTPPAHEVNFEQSIIFPATDMLFQFYELSGDKKYLDGAKKMLDVLMLFAGTQPDHHLNEVAIRHWDGFWFGKRRQYGDTFPHYWSSLNGIAYNQYYKLSGDKEFLKKAERNMRGALSMFFPDGSASCASLFPLSVNGKRTGFYDPFANDQDWALYFLLRLYNE